MLNISSLTRRLGPADPIGIGREIFPPPVSEFGPLFEAHGMEVRGKPFRLDFKQYHKIEFDGRLVWVVARVRNKYDPQGYVHRAVGYSCSWWYRDMHFGERCAADDLWYVLPEYRGRGIGQRLKEAAHEILEDAGVVRIGDNVRSDGVTDHLMHELGFEYWGQRWIKTIPGGSGN
jgi:GNAT superfamily N-acetyltransferase